MPKVDTSAITDQLYEPAKFPDISKAQIDLMVPRWPAG